MQQARQQETQRFTFEWLDHTGFGSLTTITFGPVEFAHLPITLTTAELVELTNLLNGWDEKANQERRVVAEQFICDLCLFPEGSTEEFLTVLTLRSTQYSRQAPPIILKSAEINEFREALQSWCRVLPEHADPVDDSSLQTLDLTAQVLMEFSS